jgi:DNA replication licensing factor MCM4
MLTKIKNLSQKPDIYEILSESLAPSIFEEDDVKKAVLLQLFGGSNNAKKNVKNRGNIHVYSN